MKYQYSRDTKTFKVQVALQNGQTLTAATASKRFGVKNLGAEISRIRSNGYCVKTSSRKAGNGVQVTEYALGMPSRELIAAGYKALAVGLI
jgi:hypothetical protein